MIVHCGLVLGSLEEKKEQKNQVAINLIIYFFAISKGVIRSIAQSGEENEIVFGKQQK